MKSRQIAKPDPDETETGLINKKKTPCLIVWFLCLVFGV
jgi:hypothetical protein